MVLFSLELILKTFLLSRSCSQRIPSYVHLLLWEIISTQLFSKVIPTSYKCIRPASSTSLRYWIVIRTSGFLAIRMDGLSRLISFWEKERCSILRLDRRRRVVQRFFYSLWNFRSRGIDLPFCWLKLKNFSCSLVTYDWGRILIWFYLVFSSSGPSHGHPIPSFL